MQDAGTPVSRFRDAEGKRFRKTGRNPGEDSERQEIEMKTERQMAACTVAVACVLLAGCVVVPTSGGRKTYRSLGTETRMIAEKVDFYPEAVRNGDTVRLHLVASGTFRQEITETRELTVTAQRKVAFGVLPGMASLRPGLVPGGTLLALWYNICFLTTPTLNGLLLEPFNPRAVAKSDTLGDGDSFRRSALVGFHKYEVPERRGGTPETQTQTLKDEVAGPVEGIELTFEGDPPVFWKTAKREGGEIVLEGVSPGAHSGKLVLAKIPEGHWLEDELREWLGFKMDVAIPAE